MPLCLMLSPPGNVLLVLIALETHTRDHLSLIFRAVNTFYEKAAVSLLLISEQTQFRKHGYGIFWSIVSLPLSEVFSGHSRKSGIRDSLVSLGNKANKPWNGYKSSYYLVLSPVGGGSPWGLGGGISQPTPPCGLSRQTIRFALFTCISLPPSREGTVGQTKDAGVYILGLDICHEECY